jgi:hypothetical protein
MLPGGTLCDQSSDSAAALSAKGVECEKETSKSFPPAQSDICQIKGAYSPMAACDHRYSHARASRTQQDDDRHQQAPDRPELLLVHSIPADVASRVVAHHARKDAVATWSREQLARMDSDFCMRVTIAFRAGGESMSAATATYDLPARRRAR